MKKCCLFLLLTFFALELQARELVYIPRSWLTMEELLEKTEKQTGLDIVLEIEDTRKKLVLYDNLTNIEQVLDAAREYFTFVMGVNVRINRKGNQILILGGERMKTPPVQRVELLEPGRGDHKNKPVPIELNKDSKSQLLLLKKKDLEKMTKVNEQNDTDNAKVENELIENATTSVQVLSKGLETKSAYSKEDGERFYNEVQRSLKTRRKRNRKDEIALDSQTKLWFLVLNHPRFSMLEDEFLNNPFDVVAFIPEDESLLMKSDKLEKLTLKDHFIKRQTSRYLLDIDKEEKTRGNNEMVQAEEATSSKVNQNISTRVHAKVLSDDLDNLFVPVPEDAERELKGSSFTLFKFFWHSEPLEPPEISLALREKQKRADAVYEMNQRQIFIESLVESDRLKRKIRFNERR